MKLKLRSRLVLATVSWLAVGAVSAQEVYTAKMVRKKGLSQESVQLDLHISRWATQEEADALLKTLDEDGSDALMETLLEGDFGEARVTGGARRRVVWARVFPGQNGASLMIVTEHPIYFPSDPPIAEARQANAMGVLQLEVNARGHGRGRLAEAVAVHMTDEGVLQIESARPATVEIDEVVRQQ